MGIQEVHFQFVIPTDTLSVKIRRAQSSKTLLTRGSSKSHQNRFVYRDFPLCPKEGVQTPKGKPSTIGGNLQGFPCQGFPLCKPQRAGRFSLYILWASFGLKSEFDFQIVDQAMIKVNVLFSYSLQFLPIFRKRAGRTYSPGKNRAKLAFRRLAYNLAYNNHGIQEKSSQENPDRDSPYKIILAMLCTACTMELSDQQTQKETS